MQAIWVLAVLALASADVSHLGYHYKVPQTSYGVPSYQVGGSSSQYQSGGPAIYRGSEGQYLGSSFSHGDHSGPSHLSGDAQLSASSLNGGVSSGFGYGVNSGANSLYYTGLNNGYGNGFSGYGSGFASGSGGYGINNGQYYQTEGGSTVKPIYLGGSNQFQTTQFQSGEKHQQFYQVQSNEPTQVYKHFYVHSAPEEPELPKPRVPIVVPPPQKHYKIIFVKTPNVASHSSQIVPVQPQNEEKTIVYVLVKKPEEHREVIVPKVEQKPPTKPEVYFIKYNNKEDSQAVINNIVNDYNKPGQSLSYVSGGSEGTPVVSGLPSLSSNTAYFAGNPAASGIPTSNFGSIPSGGFSNGFSKYPSSSSFPSGSSFGSSFSSPSSFGSSLSKPSNIGSSFSGGSSSLSTGSSFSSLPSSLSSGASTTSKFPSDKFASSSGSSSGFSSGSNTGLSGGYISGLSSGSNRGESSGSGFSSQFSSSSSDSSAQAPITSSSVSSQTFGVSTAEATDSGSDAGADASSLFNGVSSPSVITTTTGQHDLNAVSGTQGLPHETYGVPNFRID